MTVGAIITAVMIYMFIYYSIIPPSTMNLPAYFDFSEMPPTSDLFLTPKQWSYMSIEMEKQKVLPSMAKHPTSPILYPYTNYDIILDVTLTDSPANDQLGMVTVLSEIRHKNIVKAISTRSFLPPYKSFLTRITYQLLWAIPFATGLVSEYTHVKLNLFDGFEEDVDSPATNLIITLKSSRIATIQIVDAQVTFTPQLFGIRYYMVHFKVITFLITATVITVIELIAFALTSILIYTYLPKSWHIFGFLDSYDVKPSISVSDHYRKRHHIYQSGHPILRAKPVDDKRSLDDDLLPPLESSSHISSNQQQQQQQQALPSVPIVIPPRNTYSEVQLEPNDHEGLRHRQLDPGEIGSSSVD
jgi:hypothetical protein